MTSQNQSEQSRQSEAVPQGQFGAVLDAWYDENFESNGTPRVPGYDAVYYVGTRLASYLWERPEPDAYVAWARQAVEAVAVGYQYPTKLAATIAQINLLGWTRFFAEQAYGSTFVEDIDPKLAKVREAWDVAAQTAGLMDDVTKTNL